MKNNQVALVDHRGGNFVEYRKLNNSIMAISSRHLTQEQMKTIEEMVGLNRDLGKIFFEFDKIVSENHYLMVWTVLEAADCDWS